MTSLLTRRITGHFERLPQASASSVANTNGWPRFCAQREHRGHGAGDPLAMTRPGSGSCDAHRRDRASGSDPRYTRRQSLRTLSRHCASRCSTRPRNRCATAATERRRWRQFMALTWFCHRPIHGASACGRLQSAVSIRSRRGARRSHSADAGLQRYRDAAVVTADPQVATSALASPGCIFPRVRCIAASRNRAAKKGARTLRSGRPLDRSPISENVAILADADGQEQLVAFALEQDGHGLRTTRRSRSCSSAMDFTGLPLTPRMTSPGRTPACAAGPSTSSTSR